jgi:hypothetical protein
MSKKPSTPIMRLLGLCLISAAYTAIPLGQAQGQSARDAKAPVARPPLSYADIADLAEAAPLVANARIMEVIALPPAQATGVPAGFKRIFIQARVTGLIRGDAGISPEISYLYDAPLDSRGKVPKLKKAQVILFARPGSRPGEVQLVTRDSQIEATPATVTAVKTVLSDLIANGAAPKIIGLGDAFHVAGTVAGEGETQIFLRTQNGDPVSLSILRRPGQQPRWAVALGEIVDEAARAPARDSLLWYRLACGLPPALPAQSVRTLSVQDAEAARSDYQVVIQALGQCDRTRGAG